MGKTIECWVIPYGDGDGVVGPFWAKAPAITERRGMLSRSSCVGEVVHLIDAARLAEVERERNEARKLVKDAYDYGGGHWGDWGERALCVAEMLSDAIDSWRNGGGK